MQRVRSSHTWLYTFSHVQLRTFFAVALPVFVFTVGALFTLNQLAQNALARPTSIISEAPANHPKTTKSPVETDTPPQAATQPSPASSQSPAPTPTKAQAAAPEPTPAQDTLSIDSIGLSSRFVAVGLTSTNAIDVDPSLVGWWNGSARPGTPGAVFLDGHNPGVFRKLPFIQEGALIALTKASGERFIYTVVHVEIVQLAGINMKAALTPYGGATEGLNLMTCVGTYSQSTGTTDQRLVVYAVRT